MCITETKKFNKIVEDGQIDVTTEKTVALVLYLFSIGKKIRGKGKLTKEYIKFIPRDYRSHVCNWNERAKCSQQRYLIEFLFSFGSRGVTSRGARR